MAHIRNYPLVSIACRISKTTHEKTAPPSANFLYESSTFSFHTLVTYLSVLSPVFLSSLVNRQRQGGTKAACYASAVSQHGAHTMRAHEASMRHNSMWGMGVGHSLGVRVYGGFDDGMVCYAPSADVAWRDEPNMVC